MTEGVSTAALNRMDHPPLKKYGDKFCRDRLPWGGVTEPNACDCKGECKADVRPTD